MCANQIQKQITQISGSFQCVNGMLPLTFNKKGEFIGIYSYSV